MTRRAWTATLWKWSAQPVLGLIAALVLLATVVAGCGGQDERTGERARLVVQEELARGPVYTEGSAGFVQLWREGEEKPVCAGRQGPQLGEEVVCQVAPGDYTLVSFQRPCQGNCAQLDPPTDRCQRPLTLTSSQTVRATVTLDRTGCHIRTG